MNSSPLPPTRQESRAKAATGAKPLVARNNSEAVLAPQPLRVQRLRNFHVSPLPRLRLHHLIHLEAVHDLLQLDDLLVQFRERPLHVSEKHVRAVTLPCHLAPFPHCWIDKSSKNDVTLFRQAKLNRSSRKAIRTQGYSQSIRLPMHSLKKQHHRHTSPGIPTPSAQSRRCLLRKTSGAMSRITSSTQLLVL